MEENRLRELLESKKEIKLMRVKNAIMRVTIA